MYKRDILNDDLSHNLLQAVQEKPGARLYELSQKMNTNMPTTRFRLFALEREGLVRIERDVHLMRVFPAA